MVLKHSAILPAVLVSSLAHWRRDRDEPAAEYGSSPDSPLGRAGFEPSVPLRWCGGSRPLRSTTFGCAFPRKTDVFCERDRRFESCPPAEIQDKRREHAVASVGKHVHKGDQLAHIICRPWRYAFAELDQQTRLEPGRRPATGGLRPIVDPCLFARTPRQRRGAPLNGEAVSDGVRPC